MSQTTQERYEALVTQKEVAAFPRLTSAALALVRPLAKLCDYADGEVVFRAGQPDIDLYVVESGQMEIRFPTDGRLIAVFEPGNFSGDIDMLTGRPVIAMAVARGPTRLLCVPNSQVRSLINRVPSLGEKLILAFTRRRELLTQLGGLGLRVWGIAQGLPYAYNADEADHFVPRASVYTLVGSVAKACTAPLPPP